MLPPIPSGDRYWLQNARVPASLLATPIDAPQTAENLVAVDLQIAAGKIARIIPAGEAVPGNEPAVDLQKKLVWPCFIDMHTHLDKGHIWPRMPNPDGTFASALAAVEDDSARSWGAEDVYQRMDFGLRCSYAHGTQAIRTHIDAMGEQDRISLEVFETLRQEWSSRIALQAVSLASLDYFLTPAGERLADRMAALEGGILGGVAYMNPDIEAQVDRVFQLAQERQLDLDFHVDESLDPGDRCLQIVARAALKHQFSGQIVCGHCCSLSVQSPDEVALTLDLVRQAGIGIVSLPMCNLYLQDRQTERTPRQRGVTLFHECQQAGIPVAIASDNCRDPFHGFGDHDGLEVFAQSVKIAHLDRPYQDWPRTIAATPAKLMGLPQSGAIGAGDTADLIVFSARNFSELLSRPQSDRIVLRRGLQIDTTLPDYAELDGLGMNP